MATHCVAPGTSRAEFRCSCGWTARLLVSLGFWRGWDELLDRFSEHRRAERGKRLPRPERGEDPDAEA